MKDYYKILGVNKKATTEEIKSAYKKLAKQYHPDHGGDAEKFKEINEAHSVLSDNRKRAEYDNPAPPMGGTNPFRDFVTNFWRTQQPRQDMSKMPRRGGSLRLHLEISVYEAICGGKRTVKSGFDDICEECKGEGGINKEECSACYGTGMISRTSEYGNATTIHQSICHLCKGRGYAVIDRCPKCGGAGIIKNSREFNVKIPKDVKDGMVLRLAGQGGKGVNGGPPGDILVKLHIVMPKEENLTEKQLDILREI